MKEAWNNKALLVSPSSGQRGHGGAGEGAEEAGGGEVPEGALRGDSRPLRRQGTTESIFLSINICCFSLFFLLLHTFIFCVRQATQLQSKLNQIFEITIR